VRSLIPQLFSPNQALEKLNNWPYRTCSRATLWEYDIPVCVICLKIFREKKNNIQSIANLRCFVTKANHKLHIVHEKKFWAAE